MPFFVYEQDPFVRADIFETLIGEFGSLVYLIPSLEEAPELAAEEAHKDAVLLISLSGEETVTEVAEVLKKLKGRRVIVISGRDPEGEVALFSYLRRPFSSDGLLNAVRNVISALPSDPQ